MSWRTVCITQRCKLEYRMGYMVVRSEEIQRVHLNEIAVLIIESTSISLTAALLNELNKQKIKVIFCDEQHNPHSEMVSYHGSYNSSKCVRDQVKWDSDLKVQIWQNIVRDKITKQAQILQNNSCVAEASLLKSYITQVELGDNSNREGHAAKVYFNALFGKSFSRDKVCLVNSALDYGYSILLASFNREIHALGRLTQLGIWHDNTFNFFNLSSDLMEAFRPLVDSFVLSNGFSPNSEEELTSDIRHSLLTILERNLMVNGMVYKLPNAIRIYANKIIQVLDENSFEGMPIMTYV